MPTATVCAEPYPNPGRGRWSSLVLKKSRQFVSSYSRNICRSAFQKRCEQRRRRRLKLAHTREHLVVLKRAEASGVRVATPGSVAGSSRNATQHVD
jgi:hypothetical protein